LWVSGPTVSVERIVELAIKKTIHGQEVKNKDALKNPEFLAYFSETPEIVMD